MENALRPDHRPRGSTMRELLKTGLPIFIELVLVSLFVIVDMALLKPTGTTSIAAVGLTAEPMNLLEFAFWALQTAVVAMLSATFATREDEKTRRLFTAFMRLVVGATTALALVVGVFAPFFLRLFGAMDDTLPIAVSYFRIALIAFVFRRAYCAVADMLKALGVPKWSLWLSLLANAVNILFDILLINGVGPFPKLGAVGAAIATLIGCAVGLLVSVFIILRRLRQLDIHVSLGDWLAPAGAHIKAILHTALPMVGEKVMIRLGVFLSVRRIALIGTAAFATHRILITLQMFAFLGAEALATTMLIFASRAFAKQDEAEIRRYFKGALTCTLAFAFLSVAVFALFGKQLVGLYSDDPAVIAEGARTLLVICVFQPFQAVALLFAGTMRGCGLAKIPTVITTVGIVGIRPILVYALTPFFGVLGAWTAIAADEIFRLFALLPCRRRLWSAFRAPIPENAKEDALV